MGRFRLKEDPKEKDWLVELEQTFDDINIFVNGYVVAYFEGESGILKLMQDVKGSGLPCNADGSIKVEVEP